eukprot:TRINITY_DN31061_c0_g1_i1.p1 TRINITY_DN31061_c0_g1~~TRINITY_DN31061_c0_g1_i1.p1  ORF type:complete len:415 (+),score=102.05 TRINITY_DN31061_c0_g1_i1:79-1323(+)
MAAEETGVRVTDGLRTRTKRSLVYELAVGEEEKALGAAIGYVDDLILEQDPSLTADAIKQVFLEGLPFVSSLVTTPWGRIATVILPRMQSEVFDSEDALLCEMTDALRLCGRLGVKCVSLTGLIPSATCTGVRVRELQERLTSGGDAVPVVTTGHATTTACMALNTQRILKEAGRSMESERMCFLGLGSVGLATLRLLLRVLPHARSLLLCDVYEKQGFLSDLAEECRRELGFGGEIAVITSRGREGAPAEVYSCSLIVAATNVGDLLDVDRVAPGTCVVDDSAPHVFNTRAMWKRIRERRDVLATEGGPLRLPEPLRERFALPTRWSLDDPDGFAAGTKKDPREVMGCTLSSLLTAKEPVRLRPQTGPVESDDSVRHFEKLRELRCEGCDLNIDEVPLPPECIAEFRKRAAAP